jgi:hypothetical protein
MPDTDTSAEPRTDEDELRAVVERLSRRDRAGGRVIERAAIMAEGGRSGDLIAYLDAHGWEPEAPVTASARGSGGLHGAREQRAAAPTQPARYLLHP